MLPFEVRRFRARTGREIAVLLDRGGGPVFWPNVFVTSEHLKQAASVETCSKVLRALGMAQMWGAYVGSPVQRQSLKFFWLEECIEGENPFVAGTYEKILEAVARTARDKATLRLETKVVGVRSGTNSSGESKPSIETADGHEWSFDEVVCTMPLGWLKRNQHAFKPPLEPRLEKAISNIGYGTLDQGLS